VYIEQEQSVHLSQGDLMLSDACERYRFPPRSSSTLVVSKNTRSDKSANKATSNRSATTDMDRSANIASCDGATGECTSAADDRNTKCSRDHVDISINEWLSYVNFYRDCASSENIREAILGLFSPSQIGAAKKLLVHIFSDALVDCSLKVDRRKSTSREVHEAEVDDILGLLDYLYNDSKLDSVTFAAVNHDRVPKYGPEELNVYKLANGQYKLGAAFEHLSSRMKDVVQYNSSSRPTSMVMDQIESNMKSSVSTITEEISHLTDICSQLSESIKNNHSQSSSTSTAPSRTRRTGFTACNDTVDRSRNVVIFGVEKFRVVSSWREVVINTLHLPAGRDVMITDAFRLGRFTAGRIRPIKVKLNSAWDRRAVISGSYKLASVVGFESIYISPDESLGRAYQTSSHYGSPDEKSFH